MTTEIPVDIWLLIAEFIPESTLRKLYAVNRVFFDIAMDLRYRKLEVSPLIFNRHSDCERALDKLLNLQQPLLSHRVKKLKIANVPEQPLLAHMEFPDQFTLLTRSACELMFPRDERRIERVIELVLVGLPNVTELEIELWSRPVLTWVDPPRRAGVPKPPTIDIQALARSVHQNLVPKLQSLILMGMHASLAEHLLPMMEGGKLALPCLQHLEIILFYDSDNNANNNTRLLTTVLASFVNSLSCHLESFKIVLLPPTAARLSDFFGALTQFPALRNLDVHASFDVAFQEDPVPFTRFIHCHSIALRSLSLRLNPSRSGVNADIEEVLRDWLLQALFVQNTSFPFLDNLTIYPTKTESGFQALLAFLRTAHRLSRLAVRDAYLSEGQADILVSALPNGGTELRSLRINAMIMSASLLDTLSLKAPLLNRLTMSTMKYGLEQEINPEPFRNELASRSYSNWPLQYLNLRQRGAAHDRRTMECLFQCIPSLCL
jgi:hypothetical protein